MLVCTFSMTLATTVTLEAGVKYQYLCTLVRGEALRQFELLSANVESTQTLNGDGFIKGLAQYFPPVNSLSKQKRAMRLGMEKPRALTVRRYTACLTDINEYLESFLGAALNDNIVVTEIDEIFLNSMLNIWSRQAYVQGFDFESITFEKSVSMFECMEIAEFIYEVVVEPSYKKTTRAESNCLGHIRQKRVEAASS